MQLDYTLKHSVAFAGMLACPLQDCVFDTFINPDDEILFGTGVARDTTADGLAKEPDGSGVQIVGVALYDPTVAIDATTGGDAYPVESNLAVMKQGKIWVYVEEAVSTTDPVYVRYGSGAGGTIKGYFRTDGDTSTALLVSNARFSTSTDDEGLAILEINIP